MINSTLSTLFFFVLSMQISTANAQPGWNWTDSNDELSYGELCGYTGMIPKYRGELNELLIKEDTSKLKEWLFSDTLVLQVYAVEGFHKL
jgi:hypothetical protein